MSQHGEGIFQSFRDMIKKTKETKQNTRRAHHGTGLSILGEPEDTEQLGQMDHLQLPVQMRVVVSPDPSTMIASSPATWKVHNGLTLDCYH